MKSTTVPASILPDWFSGLLAPVNTDFDTRVVCAASATEWLPTTLDGVDLRIMEYVPAPKPRLVAQLRIKHAHQAIAMDLHSDFEILIQQGHLTSQIGEYHANWYFRLPDPQGEKLHNLEFTRASSMDEHEAVVLYLAIGQMKQSDNQWRRIDTMDEDRWLPGPVEGTDVLPLHGHGSGNVMMVRWNKTVAFKTRIDPRGEELLVLSGAVHDAEGSYTQGSWIRNPIATWQSWGAETGTVVYYKNGHFAESELT